RTNISFFDVGIIFYVTNVIGYISLFFGIKELSISNEKLNKIQPYVVVMMVHSFVFLLLDVLNISPLHIGLINSYVEFLAFVGLVFIVAGMLMIFVIIFQLLDGFADQLDAAMNIKLLYNLTTVMLFISILAVVSSIFNIIPIVEQSLTGLLSLVNVLFLISYYRSFLVKKVKLT